MSSNCVLSVKAIGSISFLIRRTLCGYHEAMESNLTYRSLLQKEETGSITNFTKVRQRLYARTISISRPLGRTRMQRDISTPTIGDPYAYVRRSDICLGRTSGRELKSIANSLRTYSTASYIARAIARLTTGSATLGFYLHTAYS